MATCTHYWVYETPNGPVSVGVCKYCGRAIEGMNYVELSSRVKFNGSVAQEERRRGAP